MSALTPDRILQTGLGFWGSKALLTAVRAGLFTELATGPKSADELSRRFGWTARNVRDFFDALLSMGFLAREDGRYANTPETDLFLDRGKPTYVGGVLEMVDARLYRFWGDLDEALKTNAPQNEAKSGGAHFEQIYADPERLKSFLSAMTGISGGPAQVLAEAFDWSKRRTVLDAGCAEGMVPVTLARRHPRLAVIGFDLPMVKPIFEAFVSKHGLDGRVRFAGGDLFAEDLPKADAVIMGHMLHWADLPGKKLMARRAFDALTAGGVFIAYDHVLDDERRANTFGFLMSLNMLIETPGGFEYTGAEARSWFEEAGFREVRVQPLLGSLSAVVGTK